MAVVYLAIQESLERPVALKILTNPGDDEFANRFLDEGRIIASLSHHNIITVHDVGVAGSLHYLAMEFLDGGDLKKRIAQGVPIDFAFTLVEQIASCLEYAHARGVIHRDIKPANILFRADGTAVLTDFGIAKHSGRQSDLTVAGTLLGSPHYLSPEQAQGKSVDGRSDIYSLGIVLFEMLTGKKPYVADSQIDTIVKQIQAPVPTLPPNCGIYQDLLNRMAAKTPEQRFATASEVIEYVRTLPTPANTGAQDKTLRLAPPIEATMRLPVPAEPRSRAAWCSKPVVLGTLVVLSLVMGVGLRHGWKILSAEPTRATPVVVQSTSLQGSPPVVTEAGKGPSTPAGDATSNESLYQLAVAHRNGVGYPRNDQEAFDLFQQAAAKDHPGAQYHLGLMYGQGRGVSVDQERAISWLEKAARQNVVDAQYLLCLSYALGRGTRPNRVMAYAWAEVAKRQGSPDADKALAKIRRSLPPNKRKAATDTALNLMEQIGRRPPVRDSNGLNPLDSVSAR